MDRPILLPNIPNLLAGPRGETHPTVLQNSLHLAVLLVSEIPSEAKDVCTRQLCASWRRGTEKSYSSAWRKWHSWCRQRDKEFLTTEFEAGKQYSTLNSYRFAIFSTHPPVEVHPVGQHPAVCRLLQGMCKTSSPPLPGLGCVTGYPSYTVNAVIMRHDAEGFISKTGDANGFNQC